INFFIEYNKLNKKVINNKVTVETIVHLILKLLKYVNLENIEFRLVIKKLIQFKINQLKNILIKQIIKNKLKLKLTIEIIVLLKLICQSKSESHFG
ncbi:MAG: hypothetical protein ACREOZ_00010, partial [Gloeomargaritales cyanobacterium]